MPELPEVEVSRRGLLPHLPGRPCLGAVTRAPRLRLPLPDLNALLEGRLLTAIHRRGKYLLFEWTARPGEPQDEPGWLIVHLGMSGSLRLVADGAPPAAHDHVDIHFPGAVLRYRDPRRFGLMVWHGGPHPERDPRLAVLGVEPLGETFTGPWLHRALGGKSVAIKQALMDSHLVVGVGNIYAAEALFRARIAPTAPAGSLSAARCARLAAAVREVLAESIALGGSSVRDYVHSDGGMGGYQLSCAVYGRTGEPCRVCATPIRQIRQGGRSTFYCPHCQGR